MRISIVILSTLAATTVVMLLSFAKPSGERSYTNAIGCAPVSKVQPKEDTAVKPMQWFVDKNMSDNELTTTLAPETE